MKLFFLYLSFVLVNATLADLYVPPQNQEHGNKATGQGGNGAGEASESHDSYYAAKPRKCHIICGPNSEMVELHFFCLKGEGQILKGELKQKTFPICRINKADDIQCGGEKDPTRFTILGKAHTSATATLKGASLGQFTCHGE